MKNINYFIKCGKEILDNIDKKDINHGTDSCLCTLKLVDDTINKLKASSTRLKKVLNAL